MYDTKYYPQQFSSVGFPPPMTWFSFFSAVCGLSMLAMPASATVLRVDFPGSDEGGTGSAFMLWDDHGGSTELTITIDNTSPNVLDNGTGLNSSLVTGFGFSIDPNLPPILTWAIFDGLGEDITAKYEINFDDGFNGAGGGVSVETLLETDRGIKGGFYNADAPGNTNNAYEDIGIISIQFATPYIMKRIEVATLRMQRVGYMGSGSLKLLASIYNANSTDVSDNPTGVPVPGAALLFLTGLGGMEIIRRRRQNKAS